MRPADFDEKNSVMGGGDIVVEGQHVRDLPIFKHRRADGTREFISLWTFQTKEERDQCFRQNGVWVGVLGGTHPPIWVSGIKPDMVHPSSDEFLTLFRGAIIQLSEVGTALGENIQDPEFLRALKGIVERLQVSLRMVESGPDPLHDSILASRKPRDTNG